MAEVACISEESTAAIGEAEACAVVDEDVEEEAVEEALEAHEYIRLRCQRLPTTYDLSMRLR